MDELSTHARNIPVIYKMVCLGRKAFAVASTQGQDDHTYSASPETKRMTFSSSRKTSNATLTVFRVQSKAKRKGWSKRCNSHSVAFGIFSWIQKMFLMEFCYWYSPGGMFQIPIVEVWKILKLKNAASTSSHSECFGQSSASS